MKSCSAETTDCSELKEGLLFDFERRRGHRYLPQLEVEEEESEERAQKNSYELRDRD